jgi:hypothetical protein
MEVHERDRLDRAGQTAAVLYWLPCDGQGFVPPQQIMSAYVGDMHLYEEVGGFDEPRKTAVVI